MGERGRNNCADPAGASGMRNNCGTRPMEWRGAITARHVCGSNYNFPICSRYGVISIRALIVCDGFCQPRMLDCIPAIAWRETLACASGWWEGDARTAQELRFMRKQARYADVRELLMIVLRRCSFTGWCKCVRRRMQACAPDAASGCVRYDWSLIIWASSSYVSLQVKTTSER